MSAGRAAGQNVLFCSANGWLLEWARACFWGQKTPVGLHFIGVLGKGCAEPWLILTDLPPQTGAAAWYGLRAWIEQGFKITKRGGWQWQRTQMRDAQRAERLWLAVAVATLWVLAVGGEAEVEAEQEVLWTELTEITALPLGSAARQCRAYQARLVSVFRRGWVRLLVSLGGGQALPPTAFFPEPWPTLRGEEGEKYVFC